MTLNLYTKFKNLYTKDNIGGLIGSMQDSSIVDCIIQNTSVRGECNVGGIVGNMNNSVMLQCFQLGPATLAIATASSNNAGGLVGYCLMANISQCGVLAGVVCSANAAGGAVGRVGGRLLMDQVYVTENVSIHLSTQGFGGLVSYFYGGPDSHVTNSYSNALLIGLTCGGGLFEGACATTIHFSFCKSQKNKFPIFQNSSNT